MRPLIIYGTGGGGKSLYSEILNFDIRKPEAFCVSREFLNEKEVMKLPVYVFDDLITKYKPSETDMIIALGYSDMKARFDIYNKVKTAGYNLINYISPGAKIGVCTTIQGDNNIIFDGAKIGPCCSIGSNNIIRQNVYIGHDSVIGNHSIISVNSTVGGFSKIGDFCYLAFSTTASEKRTFGDGCLVGMGSVVTKDVAPYTMVYGVPARVISENKRTL